VFDDEVKAGIEPDALHAYSILADNYSDFFLRGIVSHALVSLLIGFGTVFCPLVSFLINNWNIVVSCSWSKLFSMIPLLK